MELPCPQRSPIVKRLCCSGRIGVKGLVGDIELLDQLGTGVANHTSA